MAATAVWLATAEVLLNRGIDASAEAGLLARQLQGRSMQLDIDAVARIRADAHHGRIALSHGLEAPPDAAVSGSIPALWQLFQGAADRPSGSAAVKISGDAQVAEMFRRLLTLARPDPEEELSRVIGDFAARRAAQFARGAWQAARRVRRTAGENIAEYLQEEGRDLVNRTELEEFLRGVDELRESADRVRARLARLEARGGAAG